MRATWSPSDPETVQSSSSAAIEERAISVRLSSSSATVIPTFSAICSSVGAVPSLRLELGHRALDLAGARADRPGHPVQRAELVDDRALDARDRVGLELHVATRVVALDRTDQPEQAVRDEVTLVDVRGQAAPEASGDVLHERRVREDQPVSKGLVACLAELQPQGLCLVGPAHRGRIRRGTAFSSGAVASGVEKPTPRATRARPRARAQRWRRPILWSSIPRSRTAHSAVAAKIAASVPNRKPSALPLHARSLDPRS